MEDIIDQIRGLRNKAIAWDEIDKRGEEAQAYASQANCRLGSLTWHAILDDAIHLRAENARLRARQSVMQYRPEQDDHLYTDIYGDVWSLKRTCRPGNPLIIMLESRR